MDLWSLPYVNAARSALRRAGVTRLLGASSHARNRFRRVQYDLQRPTEVAASVGGAHGRILVGDATEFVRVLSYREDRQIIDAILRGLPTGGTYWDVGASLGVYSILAASRVGERGIVVAFEPESRSRARLEQNVGLNKLENVRVMPYALGRERAEMSLHLADHFTSGAHSLVMGGSGGGDSSSRVEVVRGDDLRREKGLPVPNSIKVDVEGFEEDVIDGLRETLSHADCRTFVCEVHFAVLESRGQGDAHARIESTLRSLGFNRTRWIDHSHLAAYK